MTMNMTKENRAEIKALRSDDKLALAEMKTIRRNVRAALKPALREVKAITGRIASVERQAIAEINGVHKRRVRIAKRIAVLTGRNS